MPYITVPTDSELLKDLLAYLAALRPTMATSPDTDEGARLASLVQALRGLHVNARQVQQDLWPETASEAALLKHCETRLGTAPRRGATISSGTDALRVYGTDGSTVSAGDTLVHNDGTQYKLSEGGTVGDVVSGYIDVSVESVSTGTQCNKVKDEVLTFESPPSGITAEAILQSDLTGALDQETIEELRVRLLQAFRNPPAGGRFSDYWAWAMAVTGVASAYVYGPSSVYPNGRRGMGCVDVAILKSGTGSARIPTSTLETSVQEKIDDERPSTVKDADALLPAADSEDIDIKITPETGYEFDWEEAVGGHTVAAWDSDKVITWDTDLPSDLEAYVNDGGQPRLMIAGVIYYVSAYNHSAKQTTLTVTPSADPTSKDIYPGGPLSEPVQTAIIDYVDTLGPARGDAADPEQEWDDTLRVAKLIDEAMDVTGVKDAEVITPASNVTPTDHAPSGTVDLIVYGEVTIRPA